ncbi:ATP-binding protein [uncultured Marixanthomonas sp.]|uniref:tetratricopeptide repeat-containing sensor histidine kinase n=1 Tax=uncultured Marixanthomonas sp. TaxID=757245 RepID=UPI0030DB3268|tara:strand:+ start:145710 stop:147731 length:2022 start_codon:yes stop_codon:yes gene_type:complete
MQKKFLVFYTLLLLYPFIGNGQDISFYKNKARIATDTLSKLTAIDSVLSKSYGVDNDAFVEYSSHYIELAKKIDSISLAAKKAMNLQLILSDYKNEPRRAIVIIDGVLAHKYKIKDSFLLGGLYLKRGKANLKLNVKEAIDDYAKAIDNFSTKDSIYIADAYLFSGQAYSNIGKFVAASDYYEKAYRFYEKRKEYEYMLHARQGIITMFSMNGFYDKAEKERKDLIETLKGLENKKYIITEYYNQAIDYQKTGNKELELTYLLKADSLLTITDKTQEDYINRIDVNAKLAEYHISNHQLFKAKEYIETLDQWIGKAKQDRLAKISYNGAKAKYYHAMGLDNEALQFAKKQLLHAKAVGHEDDIMYSHLLLSNIYSETGQFKKSLENKNSYLNLRDSLYNKGTAQFLAYYQTLYETEKKEKKLVEKNTNIQLLEKDNENFKKIVFFSSLAVVLLFGLILLYRNQRYLKSNKEVQEKFSQKLLVSQEIERKRISKDLHDGLGQRLLLIKNKIVANGDNDTKKMVDDAIDEVRSISRDLHPFQLQEMGITKAIEYTLTQIDENTTLFISSEIDNIDNLFTKEQEVNIYRIVQEALNNILKHAKAEASKVTVKKLTGNIIISVKDNGVGFDFTEKYQNIKSLGLKTLLERTRFLNGQMKVKSIKNNGTIIIFQFPVS